LVVVRLSVREVPQGSWPKPDARCRTLSFSAPWGDPTYLVADAFAAQATLSFRLAYPDLGSVTGVLMPLS
jgi:hypothetical protein